MKLCVQVIPLRTSITGWTLQIDKEQDNVYIEQY